MNGRTSKWNWRRVGITGLSIGGVAGAVFASTDLLMSQAAPPLAQAAQMILWFALAAAIVMGPLGLLLTPVWRWVPSAPVEPVLFAFALGLGIQIGFVFTLGPRDAVVTAPAPWIIALAAYRLWSNSVNPRFLSRAVTICLYAALAVPLMLLAGGLSGGRVVIVLKVLVLVLPALGLQWAAARFRFMVPAILVLGLGVTHWSSGHSRTWRSKPVTVTGLELPTAGEVPRSGESSPVTHATKTDSPAQRLSPNVVLIVLDTTRVDRLGCYGHAGRLTPRMDAFAAEATLYEQAISSAPWTVPSHASLFTGWYTITHGCDAEPHRWLDGGFVTLAEMLHATGYQTVGFVANGYVYNCNLMQGVEEYLELAQNAGHRSTKMYDWMSKAGGPQRWADQGAVESVNELTHWFAARRDPKRPYYLFINLMEAHWPLRPPYQYRRQQLMPGMGYLEATRIAGRFYGPKWIAGERRSQREEEAVRRLYNAEVAYQDEQLGALLDILQAQSDLDNTLVVITADHGEHQGEHGNWDHVFSLGEALIHVPLIIRYPRLFPQGQRVNGQCQLVDILPTVFDAMETPCPVKDLPGRSLVPAHFRPREYTYAEVHPYYGHLERMSAVTGLQRDTAEFLGYLRSVRTDQYKFVWSDRGRRNLYDIAADPQEAHDLVDELPEVAARLEAHMVEWWKVQPPYVPRNMEESAPMREDTLRGLRGLGYVGDK